MRCKVCGKTDTEDNWCKCIICNECGTKTHDDKLVIHKTDERMFCSTKCAEEGT